MRPKFTDKSPTKTERFHHFYMVDAMRRFEYDMHNAIALNGRVPLAWHDLSTKREAGTTRVTVRLDTDVVKWFRSMGPGYQPRMNAVLRSFMHAKLMGLLQGDDTLDMFRDPMFEGRDKPQWGDMARARGEG
ncbi:BrnA antitoxin family protein [Gymnodinialimonas sp.]